MPTPPPFSYTLMKCIIEMCCRLSMTDITHTHTRPWTTVINRLAGDNSSDIRTFNPNWTLQRKAATVAAAVQAQLMSSGSSSKSIGEGGRESRGWVHRELRATTKQRQGRARQGKHCANCCLCCLAAPFIGPFGQFADSLEVNFVFLVDIYGVLYGLRVGIWSAG